MLGLFRAKTVQAGALGELRRSGRYWKGGLNLAPCGVFSFSVIGNREKPDPAGLELAKELSKRFTSLMPSIQEGLFEHFTPYKEALLAGKYTCSDFPNIAEPEDVWRHVTPVHVLVEPIQDVWTVEIAFGTTWDVEHTVGARFQDWRFIELNGSV